MNRTTMYPTYRGCRTRLCLVALGIALVSGCNNDPNPPGAEATNTEFAAQLQETPKYLDPTASYASDEAPIVEAVYEPPYHYNYLTRPYSLEGRAATEVAK